MNKRTDLKNVTLCAVTSINVRQTIMAMAHCVHQIEFGSIKLLTDVAPDEVPDWLQVELISRLTSSQEYSRFILEELVEHIQTSHVLLVQWDGFVLDAGQWAKEFADCDYIGASWPQFLDNYQVGNGGFSLRTRKLLEACRDPSFKAGHPEDVCVCRENRDFLERKFGIIFAEKNLADRFSFERFRGAESTFGFHGVFNMIEAVGLRYFFTVYTGLQDRRIVFLDYWCITRMIIRRSGELKRREKLYLLASMFYRYLGYRLGRTVRSIRKALA